MSIRARVASAAAAAGILAAGWQVGTANGHTVTAADQGSTPTNTASSTTPTATNTPSSVATASGASGTFTGTTADHRFGSVTVTVTLTDGKITALSEQVVSDGDHKSEQINSRAIPTIRQKVLSAGSADVSTVSGATYTTDAYLTSLQSALDQAS